MSARTKKKTKLNPPLPRYIRDELRMTVALKGYSLLKILKARRLPEQYDFMHRFYHGKVPSRLAQIQLLAEGHLNYRELYELVNVKITTKKANKQTPPSPSKYKLKDILTNYSSRSYFCGEDILHLDLEKKNKSGPTLVTGRNLHAMAIRGAREYKKALAFANHRWDSSTLQPKKSGDTIDDVVEYVRMKMYAVKMKEKLKIKDGSDEDSDDDIEEENECPSPSKKSSPIDSSSAASTTNSDSELNEDEEDEEIPSDYVFPSFYVFVLYGPFVETSKQLDINMIESKDKKKGEGTRAQQRKAEAREKETDMKGDTTGKRGFTTDQRIDIENLGLRKESMIYRKHEVAMVALSLEESAMTKMVAAAESRALQRCPEYDETNMYWARVDVMLKEQDELMNKIRNFNDKIMNQKPAATMVSDFLNKASPDKKRKTNGSDTSNLLSINEVAVDHVGVDDDAFSEVSSNVAVPTEVSKH